MTTQDTQVELYCSQCGKHTRHVRVPTMLATRCIECNAFTGNVERSLATSRSMKTLITPDGHRAEIVEYTPKMITFYVSEGPHKGYYHYDRQTRQKTVTTRGWQPDIH